MQTGADSPRDRFHCLQRLLGNIFFRFNINHHVAHLRRRLQILGGNVDALRGEDLVDCGQDARPVLMDMQQTTAAVQR